MNAVDRRHEIRANQTLQLTPVNCTLICGNDQVPLSIINYHYRGACFQTKPNDYRLQIKGSYLQFKIGQKELPEKINFRITWETIAENGCFGVEFSTDSSYVLARAERFRTHSVNTPTILSQDPLDPNRIIYFKAINVSTTGMMISTSLSNKHLFPGMELKTAILEIPGIGKTDVSLFIENSRSADEGKSIHYGVSVKGSSHNYIELISKYLSNLGTSETPEQRLELLAQANLIHKNLSKHLTIREVKTQADYDQVLKLRFYGYKLAGKTKEGITWKDMGDGLANEGIVIAAFLAGQLVASAEFRLQKIHGLKTSDKVDLKAIPKIRTDHLAEINKLVVHPSAQNTDIVLGVFQKIHAIAMLNGRPDGVILAEDKLVTLYSRLGFQKAGFSYPHPTKTNTNLHLMIIHGEAYATSDGMNPYAWSVAFSESHQYFSEIGIQTESKLNLRQSFVKGLTFLAVKLFKKKKKTFSQPSRESPLNPVTRNIADPKWTKQHLNATVFLPYILESENLIGKERTAHILLEFGFDSSYFRSPSNWISIDFFDGFINEFLKFGDPFLLNKQAGYRSTSKEVLGANYFLMKHFLSPGLAFKSFESFLPKFNKTRVYKVIESSIGSCRIRITNPDPTLLPKHKSAKENWVALIEAYIQVITGKKGSVTVVKSSFDGDHYCEYLVKWKNPLFTFRNGFLFTAISLLVWQSASLVYDRFEVTVALTYFGLASLLTLTGVAVFQWKKHSRHYNELLDSMHRFEKDADERYRELQSSKSILEKGYQEGRLLENINREIQKTDDLTNILQIALESICTQFDFKRSFAMIIDDNQKILRTAAVFGGDSSLNDIWQFKVDVSVKRDSPLVLSSVFHTGQSILITNVEEHKFQLNDGSRRLIEKLQTTGFTMVPIPSEKQNWGVLIADKGMSGDIITRRDLVALQRVSQSIGLALDKKAKIENEVQVRKIFQKYVPSAVVQSTLGLQEPKLGGVTRDAICLFMDIRNFTQLSAQIPPQILCELLNRIFDLLQKSISSSNGMIDKFLGDGALVTWGAIPGSIPDPQLSLLSVQNFCENLVILNQDLSQQGLPPIEVGFGLHRGPVIAGNIGSNERMEFTVIGSTVNIASRLEQLTKSFQAQVVISDSLFSFSELDSRWTIHPETSVRGLNQPIAVASLKLRQFKTSKPEAA